MKTFNSTLLIYPNDGIEGNWNIERKSPISFQVQVGFEINDKERSLSVFIDNKLIAGEIYYQNQTLFNDVNNALSRFSVSSSNEIGSYLKELYYSKHK